MLLRLLAVLLCLALPARADEVLVFAAASLQGPLDSVAAEFEATSGHRVRLSYAGSGALARQIEAGAPAQVFIAASEEWVDAIGPRLVPGARSDILSNTLVLIGPAGAPPLDPAAKGAIAARLGGGRLAVALTEAVPAGQYAKASLTALGLWDDLAPRLAETDNVRVAAALVRTGAAPLGIVYATDAAADPGLAILGTFPEDSHPPIRYPAALVAPETPAARAFLAALGAPAARAIFAAAGFLPLAAADAGPAP